MQSSKHEIFIMTPSMTYIEDCLDDISNIADGIENYSLGQYILPSLFIKISGAQEQKLKCICWELATVDYDFRFEYLREKSQMGFSTLSDKNYLYNKLKDYVIQNSSVSLNLDDIINHTKIKDDIIDLLNNKLSKSILSTWCQRSLIETQYILSKISKDNFAQQNILMENVNNVNLYNIYDDVIYKQRNRIAHNTRSYQENLPSFDSVHEYNLNFNHYILWYVILLIIDFVFINLYNEFKRCTNILT